MSPFQRKLAAYSRDRSFLIRGVLTILAVSVVLGFVVAKFAKDEETDGQRRERVLNRLISYNSERDRQELAELLLGRPEPTAEAVAHFITFIDVFVETNLIPQATRSREEVRKLASASSYAAAEIQRSASTLPDQEVLLLLTYNLAANGGVDEKKGAVEVLREQAALDPPPRFANEFLGQVMARDPDTREAALSHFVAEVQHHPRSDFARYQQLRLSLDLDRHDELRQLLADPSYRSLPDSRFLTQLGIGMRSPGLILKGVALDDLADLGSPMMPLALFAGLVWFVVLSKLGGVQRLLSPRLLLYTLCVIAGSLSATFTLLLIVWQENIIGLAQNGEFANDLIYCISGIGLREEFAKILFFLPFVPFIAKGRTQVEILIAAGCVGLGFAINENIGYFSRADLGGPGGAFPRLVTASFLHVSWTGVLGLALCRLWHYPKRCWEELVATFVGVILVHGLYDALLIIPELNRQLGILAIVVLALTVRYYLRKVAATRGPERQAFSSLGVFVLGSAVVIGAAWIFVMRYYNLDVALDGVGKGALSAAVVAFIYINELRNE